MTSPKDLADRVQRLEEALGFAERTTEQLSAEIAVLHRQLSETRVQLKRLEARLDQPPSSPEEGSDPEA